MVLSILSVIIGYLVISVSIALMYAVWPGGAGGDMTPQFLAISSICSLGFATLGGWLTALVAQRKPITHAITLSLMTVVIWCLYTFTGEPKEPLPIGLLNLAIGTIGVMTGGWLRYWQVNAQSNA